MQNKRIVVLVVLIITAALLLGYLIGRAPSINAPAAASKQATARPSNAGAESATHPRKVIASALAANAAQKSVAVAAAPTLKDIYAGLKRRADANDADAASELYRDLRRCQMAQEFGRALPQWLKSELDRDASSDTPEQLSRHEKFLDAMQKEVDFVQRNQAFCADADPDTLSQLVPSTLKAAQLGDLDAIRCYLGGEMQMVPGLLDHPEWISDFKQNAVPLAQYGLQHGDWGTVAELAFAYKGEFSSSLLTQAVKPDALQAYQYVKLEALGATGTSIGKMQKQIDSAAEELTADEIAQGDDWAQDIYARYFNGTSSNEGTNGASSCGKFED